MTGKQHDKNRERGKTMIIKMSSQENDRLNTLVRLSGMKKQEYDMKRIEKKEIKVIVTPKVSKALKNTLADINNKLQGFLECGESPSDDLLEIIMVVAGMMFDMKGIKGYDR